MPSPAAGQHNRSIAPPVPVLRAYKLGAARLTRISRGLINTTWKAVNADGACFVLQRLNPMFSAELHADIDALTRHLEKRGLQTPRLQPNRHGALFTSHDNEIWRLFTFIDGVSFDRIPDMDHAAGAGRLVARFHEALLDLEHEFSNPRTGVHDTAKHLAHLRQSLVSYHRHPHFAAVEPVAEEILTMADALPALPVTPLRAAHGDLKLNNILFVHGTSQALCLIDLDTVTRMPLPLELGDALRSWCNTRGEDDADGTFSGDVFEAAIRGYAEYSRFLTGDEIAAIVPATYTIYVELAARFCADALTENYFGWNADLFSSHSEHSLIRARGQLAAARSLYNQRRHCDRIVLRHLQVAGRRS